MNVRIWGNYAHFYFNGIATASTSKGPIYIFRNVFGESRRGHWNTLGGSFIKTGERDQFGGGRRFVFHNTTLQPNGVISAFTTHVNPNCITRNNIFDAPGMLTIDREKEPASDYDYDYYSGIVDGSTQEAHGIKTNNAVPSNTKLFISSYKLEFYPRVTINKIKLGVKNLLIDSGARLPGFNDNFNGKAPDLGAFEVGNPAIQFGRHAYLNYDEGWAPWEKY